MVDHRIVYLKPDVEFGAEMVFLSLFTSFSLNESLACKPNKCASQEIYKKQENHNNETSIVLKALHSLKISGMKLKPCK